MKKKILATVIIDIVWRITFSTLNNIKIDFLKEEIFLFSYIITETIKINKKFKLIGKKEFKYIISNLKKKTYILQKVCLTNSDQHIKIIWQAQVVALLFANVWTIISNKYNKFANVFSLNFAAQISEGMGINNYAIKLIDN